MIPITIEINTNIITGLCDDLKSDNAKKISVSSLDFLRHIIEVAEKTSLAYFEESGEIYDTCSIMKGSL